MFKIFAFKMALPDNQNHQQHPQCICCLAQNGSANAEGAGQELGLHTPAVMAVLVQVVTWRHCAHADPQSSVLLRCCLSPALLASSEILEVILVPRGVRIANYRET